MNVISLSFHHQKKGWNLDGRRDVLFHIPLNQLWFLIWLSVRQDWEDSPKAPPQKEMGRGPSYSKDFKIKEPGGNMIMGDYTDQKTSAWCNLKLFKFPQRPLPSLDFWLWSSYRNMEVWNKWNKTYVYMYLICIPI